MMDNRQVTEVTLNRPDSFRIQTQIKSREKKLLWAAIYNWIAREYPEVAERIRNYLADLILERLEQEFKTIINTDPTAKLKHDRFLEHTIPDAAIRKEAQIVISKVLR